MPKLNEDWLATIIGLLIIAVIGLGLLGPGPQSVTVTTEAGAANSSPARAISGWSASATLAGERLTLENAPTTLENGRIYVFTCREGAITVEVTDAPPESLADGRALLTLVDECDGAVTLTYRTTAAIVWPVFGVLGR